MQSSYDYRIKIKDLNLYRTCIVYGWWRESLFTYLYIGSSTRGLERIFTHDVLNKVELFAADDEIHIWQTTRLVMLKREEELIKFFKPKYNQQHLIIKQNKPVYKKLKLKPISCKVCGMPFESKNQLACWPCRAKLLKVNLSILL